MAANYGIKFSEVARPTSPISLTLSIPTVSVEEGKNYLIRVQDIVGLVTADGIGLGLVDNTPDNLKPVSQATRVALDGKAEKVHRHAFGEIDGLEQHIANQIANHTHPMTAINGLVEALGGKSDVGHQHQVSDIVGLVNLLDEKAAKAHTHSLSDINGAVETIQSMWVAISGKADQVHQHSASDVSDFDQAVRSVIDDERDNLVSVDVGIMEW